MVPLPLPSPFLHLLVPEGAAHDGLRWQSLAFAPFSRMDPRPAFGRAAQVLIIVVVVM